MTGRILRRPAAADDLIDIWTYIARDDPEAADRVLDRIDAKLKLLADQPELGRDRSELMPGLRSSAIGNYVLFYQPDVSGIVLVRVIHGARDLPSLVGR